MNHYAQALAELQAQPDHELKQIGDQWQTPKALAWGLFHQFAPTLGPVVLDMFADDCNALVPHYYDAEDNALTQELAADLRCFGGAAFGNPPYSRPCTDSEGNPITGMEAILNYCREQRAQGAKIMLLIKAATSETWWPEDADFIQFISGRIGFEVPSWYVPRDPKQDKPSASGFASAVAIFDASWQGERRPEARLRRDDLITTGQIILDMIHRQAVALNEEASQAIAKATSTEPAMLLDEPAVAKPTAWEPPVASDDTTNAAAADELAMLELVLPITDSTMLAEQGYSDAGSIMGKQLECSDLSEEQLATVRGYVQGWLDEPYPLSEIFYRLDLAVANLLAGKPIHQGFVAEDNRSPALPHWQRHPAVKGVIYQIDDADILTPARTAELAAWIIDNLTAPGDLLAQATAKAAELLAQSAEPVQSELQLELLSEPEPDSHQQDEAPNIKPLEDWAFDYQNDELNLGGAEWSCFVAVLTVLYGAKEHYTAREVAIAISVSDEQLMDEYTTLDEETKALLRKTVSTLKQVEGYNFTEAFTMLDLHRQEAVIALLNALHNEPTLSPVTQKSVMINAITRVNEVMA
ncbi:phage N-6-adenine-methyltransferase [Aeromonas caviae]|uniref:phage N-6-adenine-methyltransferase n=1 Tax=Aeromonas caviae TaxID=648 RepID=UPI000AFA1C99|nr:phage N-6-adenine-methyltransferase [Aeromonas caviae]WQD89946.1 phage N-6-adenine-methyltransferase [Aeromonas caviae]SQH58442.1 Lambda phage type II restriction-modification system DNA N-6-adenine-methyltransferase Dam [Aeromonas caviae]